MPHNICEVCDIYLVLFSLYCSAISGLKNKDLENTWYASAISATTLAWSQYSCDCVSADSMFPSYLSVLKLSKVWKLLGIVGYCNLWLFGFVCMPGWPPCWFSVTEETSKPWHLCSRVYTILCNSVRSKGLIWASAITSSTLYHKCPSYHL